MPREVTDADGIKWSCIQAFAGLGKSEEKKEAAQVNAEDDSDDRVYVVCTPSGGAKSVRVKLPGDWEKALSDEELVSAIKAQQAKDG
jgi:hypothetical protein